MIHFNTIEIKISVFCKDRLGVEKHPKARKKLFYRAK
jgi:hypothetical protein